MPEHNQKSIGREVIEERIGLTGCWKGPSDNIPWFITVSVGSNCARHGPATLWNCYWGRGAQRTAGRKGFCASQGRGSRGTENAVCCPLAQSQLLFQAATTSHSCTSTLGVLLVLLNSDTDFIELIASTRNTQQGLENMAKVLFFTLMSASAAHTRFGAGLCHQTCAQGCSSALLKSSHFWYHSILRALHRCKFISGSTLQTLQIPERLTEVLNEHRPQSPLIFFSILRETYNSFLLWLFHPPSLSSHARLNSEHQLHQRPLSAGSAAFYCCCQMAEPGTEKLPTLQSMQNLEITSQRLQEITELHWCER